MEKYHKELRKQFERETKTSHIIIGEYDLPSWDYVFWLEDTIEQLQNTSSNNDYAKNKELLDIINKSEVIKANPAVTLFVIKEKLEKQDKKEKENG